VSPGYRLLPLPGTLPKMLTSSLCGRGARGRGAGLKYPDNVAVKVSMVYSCWKSMSKLYNQWLYWDILEGGILEEC